MILLKILPCQLAGLQMKRLQDILSWNLLIPLPPLILLLRQTLKSRSTITLSPSITIAPTITPSFFPTASLEPYTGKTFSIVIFGYSDLILVEIGGKNERQLTHEPEGWSIFRIAINRQGDKIAYVTLKGYPDIVDGMIKLLDLRTGEVRPLVGMGDGMIEYQLKWLDDTHLAYSYEEFASYHIPTPIAPTPNGGYHPYEYSVYDLTTGQTSYVPDTS